MSESKKKKKSGLAVRAKKFVSTKTAQSKVGQKIIFQAFGEEGETVFLSLIDSIRQYFGKEMADTTKKDTLAIALKVKILIEEGNITPQEIADSSETMHSMLFETYRLLDHAVVIDQRRLEMAEEKVDINRNNPLCNPTTFVRLINETRIYWEEIFADLMKEKNVAKFSGVLNVLGNHDFMFALLNEPEFAEVRDVMHGSLHSLLQNFHWSDPPMERTCRYANCASVAVRSQGLFRASGYCAVHHMEHYNAILMSASLHNFMFEDDSNSVYWLDFLKRINDEITKEESDVGIGLPLKLYQFVMNVYQWRSISSKAMRVQRAENIITKFLIGRNGRPLLFVPEEILDDFVAVFEQKKAAQSRLSFDFFDPVLDLCMSEFDQIFIEFLQSPEYERFEVATTLPDDEVHFVRKSMAVQVDGRR